VIQFSEQLIFERKAHHNPRRNLPETFVMQDPTMLHCESLRQIPPEFAGIELFLQFTQNSSEYLTSTFDGLGDQVLNVRD